MPAWEAIETQLGLLYKELESISSLHGKTECLYMFGVTQTELGDIMNRTRACEEGVERYRMTNP